MLITLLIRLDSPEAAILQQIGGGAPLRPFLKHKTARSAIGEMYTVWLAMARLTGEQIQGELVACMVLQLSEAVATRWEMALRPGEQLNDLAQGAYYGHGVDSGNACFVDAAAIKALDGETLRSLYMDSVTARYKRNNWRVGFVDVPLPGPPSANLIACSSGYGDGGYPSWWGYDDAGGLCALATDFLVLVENLAAEARLPLRDWAGRTLIHPDFPRIGAHVSLPPIPPGAHDLRVIVDGNVDFEVAVEDASGRMLIDGGPLRVYGDRAEHFLHADEPLPDDAVLVLSYSLGVRGL